MLSEHFACLRMIRLVDTEFDGIICDPLLSHLAGLFLAGVGKMFVDGFNVFNIYVALLVVRRVLCHGD